jgi:hypothetical protein
MLVSCNNRPVVPTAIKNRSQYAPAIIPAPEVCRTRAPQRVRVGLERRQPVLRALPLGLLLALLACNLACAVVNGRARPPAGNRFYRFWLQRPAHC